MNKYFLSLMSILILFQSFKVSDEIFNNKKDQKKGYIILEQNDDDEVTLADDKLDVKEEKKSNQPKFNIYWIYGAIIFALLGLSLFGGNDWQSTSKTNISNFKI